MIEVRELTERYGDKKAVDGLSFTVKPGEVTGFLGPDGAGKSTTMRMIIGLDAPTSGTATIGGRRYAQHSAPLQEIGHRPAHLRHGGGPPGATPGAARGRLLPGTATATAESLATLVVNGLLGTGTSGRS